MGLGKQTIIENIRLGLLALTIVPLKVVGSLSCIVGFYVACRAAQLLPNRSRDALVPFLGKIYTRSCLACIGFIKVAWVHLPRAEWDKPRGEAQAAGIVSNHCSWIDILIHMSKYFPSFVARGGTEKLPFIGPISQNMACIYVEREDRNMGAKGVAALVKERMQASASRPVDNVRPMLLFPEGTTTNGEFLLPFKTGAFLAGVPVLPVILKYGKGRVSPAWESISAPRHIFLMFANPFHSVTAYELPVYTPTDEERRDPVVYAQNVREYMLRYSGLKPSSALLANKRAYHALLKTGAPLDGKKQD